METIKVTARDMSIKAKHLRAQGLIPGSVFGGPLKESIDLQMNWEDIKKLLTHSHVGSRLMLELDGKSTLVQIKDIAKDSIKGTVLNISFQALKADQRVNSLVGIQLQNTEKFTSATVEQLLDSIPYSALPADMLDTLILDLADAEIGSVVCISDIPQLNNEKISVQLPLDEIIYRIVEKKASEDEEAPAEE